MHNLLKLFGASFAVLGMFVSFGDARGAESMGRSAVSMGRAGRSATAAATSARMPTMPSLPNGGIGNMSPDIPSGGNNGGGNNGGDKPAPSDCPDGGVRDSEYNVEKCMNDIFACVNNGGLPNGINDLFNEDLRNAIENGMGLCSIQVEKCVAQVRRDCRNVYRSTSDVWIDFNARKIQPEYYNFVLRKTGLTPNQAENTCMLLDKNTYGSSFNAVSNGGIVTAEYNNPVGAYNSQNGNILIKNNPQGVAVNNNNSGVDGQRGHYARWDATNAECYIRVAAYNKDDHIKNSWLFGAIGNEQPAEVWKAAGDTFSCNKDLFGFSLMKDTSTVAVVGVGGGTLLGAGVGALAGHGARAFDCGNAKHREMLVEQLRANGTIGTLNEYLSGRVSPLDGEMSRSVCTEIVDLYERYGQVKTALDACDTIEVITDDYIYVASDINCGTQNLEDCFRNSNIAAACAGKGFTSVDQCVNYLNEQTKNSVIANLDANGTAAQQGFCSFNPLKGYTPGSDIFCPAGGARCLSATSISVDVGRLDRVFDEDTMFVIQNGERSNMGKSIGIGAAVGAGTGGLATGITALVEHNNINCRVGDGLAKVAFGKSYSIGSLKDFYVKWNLRLPDTVSPTAAVYDCQSWRNACAAYTDSKQCGAAQFNYTPAGAPTTTLVRSACVLSGSACIENYPVAKSHGACK